MKALIRITNLLKLAAMLWLIVELVRFNLRFS